MTPPQSGDCASRGVLRAAEPSLLRLQEGFFHKLETRDDILGDSWGLRREARIQKEEENSPVCEIIHPLAKLRLTRGSLRRTDPPSPCPPPPPPPPIPRSGNSPCRRGGCTLEAKGLQWEFIPAATRRRSASRAAGRDQNNRIAFRRVSET